MMANDKNNLYNQVTTKALLETQKKIKVIYDYERLRGEGIKHYYNPELKLMVPIKLGRTITRLTETTDLQGRHLVYTENQKVLIPEEDIILIGLN